MRLTKKGMNIPLVVSTLLIFGFGLKGEVCKQPVLGSRCTEIVTPDCNVRIEERCGSDFSTEVAGNEYTFGHQNVQNHTECWNSDSVEDTCSEEVSPDSCYYYKEYYCDERQEGSCCRAVSRNGSVHYGASLSDITNTVEITGGGQNGWEITESQTLVVYKVYMKSDERVAIWKGDLNVASR